MVRFRNRDGTGEIEYRYLLEDPDRHGNVRLYVRRHGRKIRIRETPGTPEFHRAYQDAVHGIAVPSPAKSAPIERSSLRWLCIQYYKSAAFKHGLDARTQHVRKLILDGICRKHGHKPYALMQPRNVSRLRDEKDKPEAANSILKALRQLFKFAKVEGYVDRNPANEVEYIKTGSQGYHSWTQGEVRQFEDRHPIGTKARLALALLLYTGVRRSDLVLLGRQHARDGWLHFTAFKGRNRNPVTIDIPVLPELQAIIDATPSGNMTFLVTEFGKPFTANGFGNWFRKRCDEAGLPHCTAHGLRKAGAAMAAENGATEHQLMAIFGWLTPKEAARYTKAANRKKLAEAGMRRLVADQKSNTCDPLSEAVAAGGTNSASKALKDRG